MTSAGTDALAFWRQRLAGGPTIMDLPADRLLATGPGGPPGRCRIDVDPAAPLLAGFVTLLHRYGRQDDVWLGTMGLLPAAGDQATPLRVDLGDDPTFGDLVRRLDGELHAAEAHLDLDIRDVLEALRPEWGLGDEPVFRCLFRRLDAGAPGGRLAGADLALTVSDAGVQLEYDPRRFDHATARRMGRHLQTLLAEGVRAPERRLSRLPLLDAQERAELLATWRGAVTDYPRDACVHRLFERQAARTPERTAVVFAGVRTSYRELNGRANRLARRLRALGVGPEVVVGVALPPSTDLIASLLAVLKAGGAALALDPARPGANLRFMVEDSGARLVLSGPGGPEGPEALRLDELQAALDAERADDLDVPVLPAHASHVLYTSGSTGTPKGIRVGHAQLAFMVAGCLGSHYAEGDTVALAVPAGFGASFMVTYPCLCSGGELHVLPAEALTDGAAIADELDGRIDHLTTTPAHLAAVLAAASPERVLPRKALVLGAGTIRSDWLERLRAQSPGCRFINVLGANEAMMICRNQVGGPSDRSLLPVGRPAPNAQVYVLDGQHEPVPPGVVGELHVSSAGVVSGYLGQPATTADKFRPDPFSPTPGARMCWTGDLVRTLPSGEIEYVGRADRMVKLRGFRIEPGEIESVLGRHPAVQEAVVQVRPGPAEQQRLVAYVVPRPGAEVREEGLRSYLAAYLPSFMLPGAYVRLAALPLTPNGKLDARALPDPDGVRPELGGFAAPRDELERRLADLWAGLLGLDRVGREDNFFELGGDSLLAIRMLARVRDELGADLRIHRALTTPTIANLAQAAREAGRARATARRETAPVRVPGGQPHEPFPLTDLQQAFWVGRRSGFELGDVGSHRTIELAIDGLDHGRLERAWQRLVERHAMLRTVVLPDGTQQLLRDLPPYRIEVDDLRGLPAARVEEALAATRQRMSGRILDAGRWPLFELRASRLDGARWRLHLSVDLLIADMLSLQILLRELGQLYESPDRELEPLDLTFRDCVLAALAERESDAYRRAQDYWRRRLADLPPAPELPLLPASPVPAAGRLRFVRRTATLDGERWRLLRTRGGRLGLTPSMTLLSAFTETLATWCRHPSFTIVLTVFDRPPVHPQVDQVVGDFTSTILLAVDAGADGPLAARARRLQEQLWLDLDHHEMSGVAVLRELARARGGAIRAAMPVVFTSTLGQTSPDLPIPDAAAAGEPGEGPALPGLGRVVSSTHHAPQTTLNLHAFDRGEGIVFGIDAAEDLFPAGMLDDLFEALCGLVDRMAGEDAVWWRRRLDLVPAGQLAERRAVNRTNAPLPDALLHDLFEAQVDRRPDHVAVSAPDLELTYADLRRRARSLSGALRDRATRPGDLVAVVMEKGWQQVVGVLGALGAGAAYVPLDAGLPAERLRQLLARTRCGVALTRADLLAGLRQAAPGCLWLAVDDPALDRQGGPPPLRRAPDDLAYVIHTSGSTGSPKGVMISHRGAVNTVLDINRRFAVGPSDRVLALSALDFDLSVYDVFGTLAAGGTIVLPEASRDPARWARLVTGAGVTVWNSVPAMMGMLVEYLERRAEPPSTALRLVMLSGDWIGLGLPDAVRRQFPCAEVISLGGATEASIWSVSHRIGAVDPAWRSIPYGRPLGNQRVHVLDDDLLPRPVWVPGQLHIAGEGLAMGYWDDPVRTEEAFLREPRTGERLYRTGDLAHFLPGGDLEILGREDHQVKIRGYRIELGEIEATLAEHPGVRDAVVAARAGASTETRLVAYVTAAVDPAPDAGELADFLRDRLPAHMLPSATVVLDALPLTANGKVDRAALPEPGPAEPAASVAASAVELRAAERVAGLVARVLKREHVDVAANLFDLGATSIDVVRLVNLMEEELGSRPDLEQVMRTPVVLAIARAHLERAEGGSGE